MDEQRKEKINKILDIISRVAIALCVLCLLVGCIWSCATKKDEEPVTASAATITNRDTITFSVPCTLSTTDNYDLQPYLITFYFSRNDYAIYMQNLYSSNEYYDEIFSYGNPATLSYNQSIIPSFNFYSPANYFDEVTITVTYVGANYPYNLVDMSYVEDLNYNDSGISFGEIQIEVQGGVNGSMVIYAPIDADVTTTYTDTTNTYTASSGYDAGHTAGYNQGYNVGYNAGLAEGSTTDYNPFYDLIFALFDAPLTVIQQGFNVELFGVNLAGVITALLSLALIAVIIALVLRR